MRLRGWHIALYHKAAASHKHCNKTSGISKTSKCNALGIIKIATLVLSYQVPVWNKKIIHRICRLRHSLLHVWSQSLRGLTLFRVIMKKIRCDCHLCVRNYYFCFIRKIFLQCCTKGVTRKLQFWHELRYHLWNKPHIKGLIIHI